MSITQEIFEAFLKCPTKSYLYSEGAVGIQSRFREWSRHQQEEFKQTGWRRLRSALRTDEWYEGTLPLKTLEQRRYRLILDCEVGLPEVHTRLHALELTPPVHHTYIPIRFVPSEKLATTDKLLLAFDALALSRIAGKTPRVGKIIHGRQYATVTVPLAGLLGKARSVLDRIAAQRAKETPPPLVLNKHCAECEYQSRCRKIAVEKNDLSLLAKMTENERRKQHEKGIFTVTQLSYTFRPRKRSVSDVTKHQHSLKALAIRKNQIHIVGKPALSTAGTPVYFDVEGDPDRDFYYLIGLRTRSVGSSVHYSFWANDPIDERDMWADCLYRLTAIDNPRLIHYGSYETQFLKRMRIRYPNSGNSAFLDQLTKSALNLLSPIYAHVYFPTYSNSLKEVARYLGFSWSDSTSSGLTSLVWRSQWESSREPSLKQKLVTYNTEDCEAAEKVSEALYALCQTVSSEATPKAGVVNVGLLKREYPQRFGEVDFVLPEFQQINEAAYWDYQRNRVYVRSNRRLRRLSRETLKGLSMTEVRPNKIINVEEPRPVSCCHCNGALIYKWGRFSQTVYDLRSSLAGMKRWVVRYLFSRYICWHCKKTFHQYIRKCKYGVGLCAYLIYQIIEMQIPQNAVAKSVRQLFGLPMSRGLVNHVKAAEAGQYRATYRAILDRISTGKLVHADETKVGTNGKDGYVWVFTNLEDVAFVYSETRDASTAQHVLQNFRGVLVSDFYAGYDSIDCAQQKCLIHLIRDVNDDLCKQPFNDGMKDVAQKFATLLKPIVESVDRFGLKAYHLRKHKCSVDRFYEALSKRDYQTEVAVGYRKRFEKNRAKLFTFLDHDGVPWNNNNAEHAVKALVGLRNRIGGKSSANGMRDYLVLLSICETCKCKGASFLDFLRSGEMDVNAFADRRRRTE
jgi:predicted RecB family nuclease